MRTRAFRRHRAGRHMQRRLKEDRNQHYDRLDCPGWTDPKAMALFKSSPSATGGARAARTRGTTVTSRARTG
jgi:hypothetical protein